MINIKCSTPDTVKLRDLKPFQGELKKRTEQDIADLIISIKEDGLLTPFFIWKKNENLFILDGHGRMQALVKMALDDPMILDQEFPCIPIEAETEDDARKALLQIVSTYGKISKPGVIKFASSIIEYKAPALIKAVIPERRKAEKVDSEFGKVTIKLKIDKSKAAELVKLLSQVNGVELI